MVAVPARHPLLVGLQARAADEVLRHVLVPVTLLCVKAPAPGGSPFLQHGQELLIAQRASHPLTAPAFRAQVIPKS